MELPVETIKCTNRKNTNNKHLEKNWFRRKTIVIKALKWIAF